MLDAGAAAFIAKGQGSGVCQTKSVIKLLEQQHAAIADTDTAIECGLLNAPSNAPKLDGLS